MEPAAKQSARRPLLPRPVSQRFRHRAHDHRRRPLVCIMLLSATLALLLWAAVAPGELPAAQAARLPDDLGLPASTYKNLAMYAPYFPAGRYELPPLGCVITQANILQRHGARFPTASAAKSITAAIAKLQAIPRFTDPRFAFIHNYTYTLGTDSLVPFGAQQSRDAGAAAYARYPLATRPFVRASSSQRVVDSATNWTAGFAAASFGHAAPALDVVLDEARNDTLDDNMCPNAGSSSAQTAAWLAASTPATLARLQRALPDNATLALTPGDMNALESLCAFDSVARGNASAWCGIFGPADFEAFEYYGDLNKYYGTGPGQPLGRVQGVGYVNELLARLTGTPVVDHTQTNTTLDADPATFPLDRALYADFSHDNQIAAIFAALGLFATPPLNATVAPHIPQPAGAYVASRLVPFSGRLVTERLACAGVPGRPRGDYVRMFVNDAPQPLAFCAGTHGLCELKHFVASQNYSRSEADKDWAQCGYVAPP